MPMRAHYARSVEILGHPHGTALQRPSPTAIGEPMAGFVKLDCGILDSTLWLDKDARDVFITALLLATPMEIQEEMPTFDVTTGEPIDFTVPPGWYGFVHAAAPALAHRAMVDIAVGKEALQRLSEPEAASRTPDFEGRRMVRVKGGFVILNWERHRNRDYTSTERSRRWRERQKALAAAGEAVTRGNAGGTDANDGTPSQDGSGRYQKHTADAQKDGNDGLTDRVPSSSQQNGVPAPPSTRTGESTAGVEAAAVLNGIRRPEMPSGSTNSRRGTTDSPKRRSSSRSRSTASRGGAA